MKIAKDRSLGQCDAFTAEDLMCVTSMKPFRSGKETCICVSALELGWPIVECTPLCVNCWTRRGYRAESKGFSKGPTKTKGSG